MTFYNERPTEYVIRKGRIRSSIKSRRIVSNDGLSCTDIICRNLYGTPTIVYYYNRYVEGCGNLTASGTTLDDAIKSWREKHIYFAS
jgi:hypothetical protein